MNKEELIQFLKDNLTIELSSHREGFRDYLCVSLLLNNEEISKSVNYEVEIQSNYE